jgi:hypothetical protein
MGVSQVTGWRWRKLGFIRVLNVCGRNYVTREEIGLFEERAKRGEFSRRVCPPHPAADELSNKGSNHV